MSVTTDFDSYEIVHGYWLARLALDKTLTALHHRALRAMETFDDNFPDDETVFVGKMATLMDEPAADVERLLGRARRPRISGARMNEIRRLDKQFDALLTRNGAALIILAIVRAIVTRIMLLLIARAQPAVEPLQLQIPAEPAYPGLDPRGDYVCAAPAGSPIFNKFTGERISPLPPQNNVQSVVHMLKTRRSRWPWAKGIQRAKPIPAPAPTPTVSHRW